MHFPYILIGDMETTLGRLTQVKSHFLLSSRKELPKRVTRVPFVRKKINDVSITTAVMNVIVNNY